MKFWSWQKESPFDWTLRSRGPRGDRVSRRRAFGADVALHRFIEVSVGIVIALLVVAILPERRPVPAKCADE